MKTVNVKKKPARLISAYISSQYLNALNVFLSFLIIDRFATNFITTYSLCIALYSFISKVIYGIISSVGIWGIAELKKNNHDQYQKYLRYGLWICIITGSVLMIFFFNLRYILIYFLSNQNLIQAMHKFYSFFIIGIIPNFIIMLLIQIYSSKNQGRMIIKIRMTKLIIMPSTLLLTFLLCPNPSTNQVGLTFGIGYLATASFFMTSLYKHITKKTDGHKSKPTNSNNKSNFLPIFLNGLSYSLLITSELAYNFLVLFFLSTINITVEKVYYFIQQIIFFICTLPFAVSQAIAFTSSINGIKNLKVTLKYCLKIAIRLLLVMGVISIILLVTYSLTLRYIITIHSITDPDLKNQYRISYFLIPLFLFLEILRYFLMAILRGIKYNFLPMMTNVLAFTLISLPCGIIGSKLFNRPVISFVIGELLSISLTTLILYYILIRYSILTKTSTVMSLDKDYSL